MKRLFMLIYTLLLVLGIQRSLAQKMTVKDADSNILMEVNDEGSTGSITLPSGAAPTVTANKLYNVGGVLYWNGGKIPDSHSLDAADGTPVNVLFIDNDGEVGIGVTDPDAKLEVNGQVKITDGTQGVGRVLTSDGAGLATWQSPAVGGGGNTLDGAYNQGGPGAGRTITANAGAVKIAGTGGLEVDANAVLGASTSTTETLSNTGFSLSGDDVFVAGTAGIEGNVYTDGSFIAGATTTYADGAITKSSGSALNVTLGGGVGDDLIVDTGTLVVESDNNRVGIGTTNPGSALEVNGQVTITGGTPGAGQILTSDGTGLATWEPPAAVAGNTLDAAYDQGGAGAGRTITADNGAVTIAGAGGLEVAGQVKITGGSPGLNKVLTSDGAGLASWQTATTGVTEIDGLSDGKTVGNSVYLGTGAGTSHTTGNLYNIGVGIETLKNNTGEGNTASGFKALFSNTTGTHNTANGLSALHANTTGNSNTASGTWALVMNSTGGANTAGGHAGLFSNTTGGHNTAVGFQALFSNTTGNYNTAMGSHANHFNEEGSNNTIIGYQAGCGTSAHNKSGNVFLGYQAGYNETGSNKLFIENSDSPTPLIGGDFDADRVDINGQIKITGGSPGAGKVLTSDAAGLATWQTSTGVTEIDGLSDGKTLLKSVYLGSGAGANHTLDYDYLYNTAVGTDALKNVNIDSYDSLHGAKNTASGYRALSSNTTGFHNTAMGFEALSSNINGKSNTASGYWALSCNLSGSCNTASGLLALYQNTVGQNNTACGTSALAGNTVGNNNTACGYGALSCNLSGSSNTACGTTALAGNKTGFNNTAMGVSALFTNRGGNANTASGYGALYYNSEGDSSTASGYQALYNNTTGTTNTAMGVNALYSNTTGNYNTAMGVGALYTNDTGNYNTAIGYKANYYNEEGSYNTIIGYEAGMGTSTDDYFGNVFIGYRAGKYQTGSNLLYIENTDSRTPLIYGDFSADQVGINTTYTHTLTFYVHGDAGGMSTWKTVSDGRLKENVQTIPNALDKVKQLRGVNFEWKETENHEPGKQMGFIAQETEAVIPEVVDNSGDFYMMQYAPITALLVEAVKEQQETIEALQKRIEVLEGS